MRALLIAVLVLFGAHSASVAVERERGAGIHRGGGNAAYGQRHAPRGNWQHRRGYGPHYRGPRYDPGTAILGGIIGGFLGTIFAPPPPPPPDY